MNRNPDIDLETQLVPEGCYLHIGQNLQRYARLAKVPFVIGWRKGAWGKRITIGLIIRETDRVTFDRVLAKPRRVQPGH